MPQMTKKQTILNKNFIYSLKKNSILVTPAFVQQCRTNWEEKENSKISQITDVGEENKYVDTKNAINTAANNI